MTGPRRWTIGAASLAAILLGAGAGAAQAPAPEPFAPADESVSCRGSAVRIADGTGDDAAKLEPFVASAEQNCIDDDAGAPPVTTLPPGASDAEPHAAVAAAYARSRHIEDEDGDTTTGDDENVVAHAEAGLAAGTLSNGSQSIAVALASSEARVRCVAGQPQLESSSRVAELTVNGTTTAIGDAHTHIPGVDGPIHVNHTSGPVTENGVTTLTQRAVWLENGTDGGGGEIVIGEAQVSFVGNPCTGRITVALNAVADGPQDFGFTGAGTIGSFALDDDDDATLPRARSFDLPAGSYQLTQGDPGSFPLADVACVGDEVTRQDATVTVDLQRSEDVACTFTNVTSEFCPTGSVGIDGRCYLPPECPAGTTPSADGTQCLLPPACPPGSIPDASGNCVILNVICPAGTALDDQGRCALPPECPPGTFRHSSGACIVNAPPECPRGSVRNVLGICVAVPRTRCVAAVTVVRRALVGTARGDRMTGTNRSDRIVALGGNDRVSGGRGNDCLEGGEGRDTLDGSNGRDRMFGGAGNDAMNGGTGPDRMEAGAGRDRLTGGSGSDAMSGGDGSDRMSGGLGNDVMSGGGGADFIDTGNGRNRVNGGAGNDVINAATAGPPEHVDCGPGFDLVRVNANDRTRNCERVFVLRRTRR